MKKYCYTVVRENGELMGGDADTLEECDKQKRKGDIEFYSGLTPRDLLNIKGEK